MIAELERVSGVAVSRETLERLETYVELLKAENQRQNLVSRGTLEAIWQRHILDSAQLLRFRKSADATWLDIGSGAGLPGIVIACLTNGPVTLVEPRRLRAVFLSEVIDKLGLGARVQAVKAERASGNYAMITARAVASLSKVLEISHHLSTRKSCWVLPKGKSALAELAEARNAWQGVFHVEQSLTDPDSQIIVARDVRAKRR